MVDAISQGQVKANQVKEGFQKFYKLRKEKNKE